MSITLIGIYVALCALALALWVSDKKVEKLERSLSKLAQMEEWWKSASADFEDSDTAPHG